MILMRHGECFANYKNNPSLTINGKKDIEIKVKIIKQDFSLTRIFCSHKNRAVETANIFMDIISNPNLSIYENMREVSLSITDEERQRIDYVVDNVILKNIDDNNLIIISHMNFLTNIVAKITDDNIPYFEEYGSAIKILPDQKIEVIF